MVKIKSFLSVLLILFISRSFAQKVTYTENLQARFNTGVQLYDSSMFEAALKIFDHIITQDESNICQKTISYIFESKCLVALKKYEEGKVLLDEFVNNYPSSLYCDEAKLILAKIFVEQSYYYYSFKELISILEASKSSFYLNYSKKSAEKIALNYLTPGQIRNIYDSLASNEAKPFVLLTLGKLYSINNDIKDAEESFSELLRVFPQSEEKSEAATLYNKIEDEKHLAGSPLVAALFPISSFSNGEDSTTTSEILEGMKFAFSEYNNKTEKKVGLIIKNTGRNKEQIEKIKDVLIKNQSLKVILGPVYSDEVKMVLEAFKNTSIPIISPTATDDSLTDIYPNFFQANPSFLIRGRILAEYIYFVENKSKMAVLNSIDNYSSTIANSFIKEFEDLGGKIVICQIFNSDSLAFGDQIAKIAEDSSELDGVFIPLFNKNIVPIMLSQFAKYNFELPLYGNQDWFLAKGYESYPVLSNKLTFSSDYYIDYNDTLFQSFSKKFTNQTRKEVNRNVLYGYDAADFLLSEVKDFSKSPVEIKSEISSGTIFSGYHNQISFDSSRVNKFVNILRYKDGKFELVDKFKLSK
jgi:branched-chain amino acid transport system substrate-binding protein